MRKIFKLMMATGIVAAGLAAGSSGAAAAAPARATLSATVEGISEYKLPNGLSVILFPDASKPTATVNMTYKVGSRNESYGETGMAHLLEHLMFKGSKNFPSPTKEFSKRGFRMNGSTWFDRTNYFVSFTATDDNMDWALRWSADAMVNSFISRKDLDSEMTVVRNEYEIGENKPVSVVLKRMQCMLYDWHNYGKPTIGARSDIENVGIENLQAFYHRYYQPDNAVLTVSGKFDKDRVLALVEEVFGAIPRPERKLPAEWTVEPSPDGERFFTVRRPGEAKLVAVGYRVPAARDPDFIRVSLGLSVMTDDPKGRLYKALVDAGLADAVFGFPIATRDPGFVFVGAMLKKEGDEEKVRDVLVKTLEGAFKDAPVTEDELRSMVEEEKTGYERMFADPEAFGVELSEYIGMGDWRLFFVARDSLSRATPDEVTKTWGKYFVRDNRVVGMFLPEAAPVRVEMPATKSVEEIIASQTFKSEGEVIAAFDSSQDNINARTSVVTIGGVKAALLPKESRGKTVTVDIRFDYGNVASHTGRKVADSLIEEMIERGTADMTSEEISDRFTALKCDGGISSFTTDREHAAEALRFIGKLINEASFPADEFEKLRREMTTSLASKTDNPVTKAVNAMAKHFRTYPADDPRSRLTDAEIMEKLASETRDGAADYYAKNFQNVNARIAVVGDFDPKEVEAALKESFTKKSDVAYERIVSEFKPVEATRIVIDTPQKENAFIFLRRDFAANVYDKDAAAMLVANRILGGGSGLSSRLADRLRQKDGISYSVGSSVNLPGHGNRASLTAYAMTAPQNLAQAEKDFREELERAVRDGVTAKELEEAKAGFLDARSVNRSQDKALASGWASYLADGCDWTKSKELDEATSRLTVDDVNQAMRKIVVTSEITYVLAGDKEKAAKEGKAFE